MTEEAKDTEYSTQSLHGTTAATFIRQGLQLEDQQ
jgi:hypothetical protein